MTRRFDDPQRARRIVLGVTSSVSLKLMHGFPGHLVARGWEVHVVAGSAPSEQYPPGVTFHVLPMAREPALTRDVRGLVAWIRLLRRLEPSTVMAGTPKAGLLATVAAFLTRVPVRVYLLRGLRLETERGWKRTMLRVLEWLAARAATRVVAVSPSLRQEFLSLGLASSEKVQVIGAGSSNGVEIQPWPVTEAQRDEAALLGVRLGVDPALPTIGFVGRLARDKGLPTLLAAVERLRREGQPVQVILVGGEEPAGLLAKALADTGAEAGAFIHAGPVPDVRPYYLLMDVLCLPTLREGFPNVVLEAAVACVPAVVSDVTGGVDSVVDGETGLWFRVGDSADLAVKLAALLADGERRRSMGHSARARVEESFDQQIVWSLTEDFLNAELSARRGQMEETSCGSL